MSDEKPISKVAKGAGIVSLVALIPALIALNTWYVSWHDARYPLRSEVVMLAESETLRNAVSTAQRKADENSKKLDVLLIGNAVQIAATARQELDRLEANPRQTADWRQSHNEARLRLEKAEQYRDCLIEGRLNCDSIRVW